MVYRVLPLMILLLAAGCNLPGGSDLPDLTPDADNIIYVTATPEGGVPQQAAAVTEVPALPTPTPEPTPEPSVLVRLGDQHLLNGRYEDAVAAYQAVLEQGEGTAAEVRATAAFKLGQSAVREGLFNTALEALNLVIERFPQHADLARAHFLRGDAYLGLSMWEAAIADFQQYLVLRPGVIDSYVYERIADAQLALGQTEAALNSYGLALEASRSLVPQLALRERVASIYLNLNRVAEAVAQYDAILEVARNAPYRANMDYQAARALVDSGDLENGLARMRRVFNEYSETPTAYLAMQVLLDNGVQLDGLTRGRVAFRYGDYQGAIAAFNNYSSEYQVAAIPAELYLLLGRAYREIGNPSAALVAFQTIIEQYPQDPLFGEALLERGRTRFLSGDIPGAIEAYLSIADNYGYLADVAAQALWRAGYLYGTNNNPTLSRETFVRLANSYPQNEWATNGLFLAASAAVTAQQWAIAENLYGRIATLATGEDQAAAYLWVGRLARDRGDLRAAEEALNLAIAAAPGSYYAARAADIRADAVPFSPPAGYRFDFDELADLAAAESWLRATFSITAEGELWRLSPALENDPRMIRGRELWFVAAYREALTEFTALLDESRNNRDALSSYQLAIFLRSIGAYQSSIVAAADVIIAAGVTTLQAPAYIARLRYPVYYLDLVLEQALKYNFDPLLMFALIRQESLFNANASSVANANGLTQVIPSTGQYIANQLGHPNFSPGDLFRPYISMAFGAFYFDEQLRRFSGNAYAALAAYNAGPGRAIDWMALSGGDPDLFMTAITLSEPRLYIQRIYSHYDIYRALYGVD